jgi:hypothetical protein
MYAIFVDLTEAIEDIYPGLSISEVETIAKDIHQSWDYSSIYDEVVEQIDVVANNNQIALEGKDGIQTQEIYDTQNDPYGGY